MLVFPQSGRYRDLSSIIRNRTHVIALTKVDLSDSAATKNWIEHLRTPFTTDISH